MATRVKDTRTDQLPPSRALSRMQSGAVLAAGKPAAVRSNPLVIEAYLGSNAVINRSASPEPAS